MWGVKMRRFEDEKMSRCEGERMICADVKMRRFEDEKMSRCEGERMICEDVKM